MANDFYNRGASFNPDELADGDAIEAEFDAVARGFVTIKDLMNANQAGNYRNADNIDAGTLAKERLPGTIDSSTTGTAANAELLDGLDSTRFSRSAVGQLNNYDNWDTFTSHGTYKVNSPNFTGNANAPPSTYGYGILQVEVSEIGVENRTNQVYYPHNNDYDKYIYQRMLNGGIWTAWSKIWRGGTASGSGLVAVLTGDSKHRGLLPIPAGYAESECRFFISAQMTNPSEISWYLSSSIGKAHYLEYFYLTENRKVIAITRVYDNGTFKDIEGWVNYIVIGCK